MLLPLPTKGVIASYRFILNSSTSGALTLSPSRNDRKIDEASSAGPVIDPLRRFRVVPRFGEEDVRNEGLRVAIIKWKPARLDLHHYPVAREEHVVRRRQDELVAQRLVRRDRFRCFEAFSIPPAEDIHRDAELITSQLRLARDVVWIDVDQLDHPVGVGAARGGDEVHNRSSADAQRFG